MASRLHKYVGRPSEAPPIQEADDDLNERVKERMERMGMVEGPSSRRRSDQVFSNRQMIADRARVTPRSLNLTRGTSHEPVTTDIKPKKPMVPSLQRRDSFPGTTHYYDHDNGEGGPFDTDAENLDSTTNISDVGDSFISRPWHEGDGDLAVISRHPYPTDSEYQESLDPSIDQDLHQRAHIEEQFSDGNSDGAGMSETAGAPYQSSLEGQPQYGLDVVQDLMQEQRQNALQSPVSRRKALDDMMDSPSIQQTLAHKKMTARPRHPKPVMASLFSTSNHGPTQPVDDHDGEAPPLKNTDIAVTTFDMNLADPAEPKNPEKIARDMHASPVSLTVEQQNEQPQQRLHLASKVEPVRAIQQHASQRGASLGSQGESKSPRAVSLDHQRLKMGIQPAATAESKHEGSQGDSADSKRQQLPKAAWQSLNPPMQGRVETQTDIAGHMPVLATIPNLAAAMQSKTLLTDNLDGQLMGKFGAPELPPPQSAATGQSRPKSRKHSLVLDYSPSELSRMPYKLLQSESFDHVPGAGDSKNPNEAAKVSLAEKVQHAYNLKGDIERQSQRQGIFSILSIEQYEEAGDLLLEKFANVIGCYKEARQAKRKLAKELEKEVAQREELVRTRTLAVERELTGLKHAGRKVVQGKYT